MTRIKVPHEKIIVPVEGVQLKVDLKSQYVTVPPGDEARPVSCPICKEALQIEFLEDEEEWVWRNAVKKDDRVSNFLPSGQTRITDSYLGISCNVSCRSCSVGK